MTNADFTFIPDCAQIEHQMLDSGPHASSNERALGNQHRLSRRSRTVCSSLALRCVVSREGVEPVVDGGELVEVELWLHPEWRRDD